MWNATATAQGKQHVESGRQPAGWLAPASALFLPECAAWVAPGAPPKLLLLLGFQQSRPQGAAAHELHGHQEQLDLQAGRQAGSWPPGSSTASSTTSISYAGLQAGMSPAGKQGTSTTAALGGRQQSRGTWRETPYTGTMRGWVHRRASSTSCHITAESAPAGSSSTCGGARGAGRCQGHHHLLTSRCLGSVDGAWSVPHSPAQPSPAQPARVPAHLDCHRVPVQLSQVDHRMRPLPQLHKLPVLALAQLQAGAGSGSGRAGRADIWAPAWRRGQPCAAGLAALQGIQGLQPLAFRGCALLR